MENETFILETENETIECNVLCKFKSEEYKKNYIVYTDNTLDEEGEINIFIGSYEPDNDSFEINDIKDENELSKISEKIEDMWR